MQVGLLLPPLNRPGIDPALTRVAKEAVAESTGWHSCPVTVLHGGRAETVTLIKKLAETPLPETGVSLNRQAVYESPEYDEYGGSDAGLSSAVTGAGR
ncbi:hypothetical protein ACFFVU_003356 [Salmonella enterica]